MELKTNEKNLTFDSKELETSSDDVIIIEEGSPDFQHISLMCGINNSHLRR